MGFFDRFQQQPKSESDALGEEWAKRLFPGGRRELLFRADVLIHLSNGKLTVEDAARLCGMLKSRIHLASDLFDGRTNFGLNATKLVEQVKIDSQRQLSTTEAAAIAFYLVFDQVDNGVETYALLHARLESAFGSDSVGCDQDEIPGGLGEFGLDAANPIPVRGIKSNAIYLDCLRTSEGQRVNYTKRGSGSVPNIVGPVYEYEVRQGERPLCKLYLAPYNSRISQRPPLGFSLLWSSDSFASTGEALQPQPTTSAVELPPWADWSTKLFTLAAKKRNVEILRTVETLIDYRQEQVGGRVTLRRGTGPAKVLVNYTDLASWGFAFFRIFLDDLLKSPHKQDRAIAGKMLETADRDPGFHPWIKNIITKAQQAGRADTTLTVADCLDDPNPLFMSSEVTGRKTGPQEEYIAHHAGQYFANNIGVKVTGFVANSKDFISAAKLHSGNATLEDASRILHDRFFADPDFHYTHCKQAGR